jgi:hypothetical protein
MNQKLLSTRERILSLRLFYLGLHRANQLVFGHLQIKVVALESLDGDLHGGSDDSARIVARRNTRNGSCER